jgi:hypothetical protein
MSTKMMGIGLIVVGIIIIAVALSAGYIGLAHTTTLSTNKLIMAAAGLVVGIVGGILVGRKPSA